MHVRFEATGVGAASDLRSLHRWLTGDRGLRGDARISTVEDPSPGTMGSGLEAVLAAVSTAAALSQLPFSYLAWRQGRRPEARIVITVQASDEAEAAAMLRRLGEEPPEEPQAPLPEVNGATEGGADTAADTAPGTAADGGTEPTGDESARNTEGASDDGGSPPEQ